MKPRRFTASDIDGCLEVFDTNVPDFFTVEERSEFTAFLRSLPGPYFVLEGADGKIGACGGYALSEDGRVADLCWGMVRLELHGRGVGRALTQLRVEAALQEPKLSEIALNTSQHTRGFYEKMGFRLLEVIEDGYAPGLHRCEMRMRVGS